MLDRAGDCVSARVGRGDDAGVLSEAFTDFFDALVLRGIGKLRTARRSEGYRVAYRALSVLTRLIERSRQCTPFEPQPDSSFDRVQMRVLTGKGYQLEVWLNSVKQLV